MFLNTQGLNEWVAKTLEVHWFIFPFSLKKNIPKIREEISFVQVLQKLLIAPDDLGNHQPDGKNLIL